MNSSHIAINVGCDKNINPVLLTKLLGIKIDNTLTWKTHIEMIIPKLCVASFAVRAIKTFVMLDTLKMVYHSYFYSIINYGIIFWGNSSFGNSIFKLRKRIIGIILGVRIRDLCREFLKLLNILPLISQYVFSLLLFVVNNNNQLWMNSEICNINTRNNSDFYQPLSHLTIYQKCPFYIGIKLYNRIPAEVKSLSHNIKKFK